ncbi:MAG: condensin complex protein MksE [Thiomonas sp.]
MTIPQSLAATLSQMPALAELFRLFLSGKHLNRMAEPALWAELEQHEASYVGLFAALGFDLRLDARGFAWFYNNEANSNIGKISRQLALLFMVVFDAQANAGKPLQRFTDWLIDSAWLAEVYKQQQDLLDAEGLNPDALLELLGRACNLGFAVAEPAGWRLLPAVCRYLDHFESLALTAKNDGDEESAPVAENRTEDVAADEENT